jgi:hypothetical protein
VAQLFSDLVGDVTLALERMSRLLVGLPNPRRGFRYKVERDSGEVR